MKKISVVITDLDNTLFDWVEVWHASFSAMLSRLAKDSGVPAEQLIEEFRKIHQKYGTSEYAFSIEELPSLVAKYPHEDLAKRFYPAIEDFRAARNRSLKLYPCVSETLEILKDRGSVIVGYTDSMSFYTRYRVRQMGLDRILDYLYYPPDHPLPNGREPEEIEIRRTALRELPPGEIKPNPKILLDIIKGIGASADETLYVGNSLMKDVLMAQRAGVTDVYASYGNRYPAEKYDLLKKVTHWTAADVEREKHLRTEHVRPSHTLHSSFAEIANLFEFVTFRDRSTKSLSAAVDIWKKVVDVQMHFNDLELRIRNFAVTVMAAMLGLAAYALNDNLQFTALGHNVHVAAALLFLAIIPWGAFYVMDFFWYHKLLNGAVQHGQQIEHRWEKFLPELGLTASIGRNSPVKVFTAKLHSKHKMLLFYLLGVLFLVICGFLAQFALPPVGRSSAAAASKATPAKTSR